MTRAKQAVVPSPKFKKKTDNNSIADKCALRRLLIKEMQLEPLHVLDLFAGEGRIWSQLRSKPDPVEVLRYTPVDSANRQPGQIRFKITPRLVASLNGDEDVNVFDGTDLKRYNVVDVDCYGDPFEIWHALLFRIKQPTAVFLTRGKVTYGVGRMPISEHAKKVMGIPAEWDAPGKIELLEYGDRCQLLEECPTAQIVDGYVIRSARVDYYALNVEPIQPSGGIDKTVLF